MVSALLHGHEKRAAYTMATLEVTRYAQLAEFNLTELNLFERILSGSLINDPEEKIQSEGYVLHTLEAAIWCFMNSESYKETVLKAVNLGGDTDTTACVTGALAGLYYGSAEIPDVWKSNLARRQDIITLARNFQMCMDKRILA